MSQNKINYAKILAAEIEKIRHDGTKPKLLLHCCCAPCSSYVLEYLDSVFEITPYFYNPNISPRSEYDYRAKELARLIDEMPLENTLPPIIEHYDNGKFESKIKGLENEKEGGARCAVCFKIRLSAAADFAKANGFDYFCTTLTISPLKNAQALNKIGENIAEKTGVKYLFSDFKKNEGYKRSIALSNQYSLYRQNYCGCKYSKPNDD